MTGPSPVVVAEFGPLPPPAIPLPWPLGSGNYTLITVAGALLGWSISNSSTTTASVVTFYDGATLTGQVLAAQSVGAGQSSLVWLGPQGVKVTNELVVRVASQGVLGCAWFCPAPR